MLQAWIAAAALAMQPAASSSPPAPAPDALVERLISVFPDRASLTGSQERDPDPAEVSRLNGLNPGHEAEVMTTLRAYQACLAPVVAEALPRIIRRMIAALGEAKVRRMIEFYQGTDYPIIAAFDDRQRRGEQLGDADRREAARILAAYPLSEFLQALQNMDAVMHDDRFLAGATRCSLAKRDALNRLGLRIL
jgi:hypothetical protein